MTVKQTAGHDALGEFAPEFAHLNDDILFGEIWNREAQLPLKLRSIVTVSTLIGKGITDGLGEPNVAFGKYFIGQSYLKALTDPDDYLPIHNVTFEPGCRNNWHIHHASKGGGQVLVCVDGEGWYQEEGKPAQRLHPGDIVEIPANVKHWHGAAADCWFSHLAFEFPGEETSNEWLESVDDEQYGALEI